MYKLISSFLGVVCLIGFASITLAQTTNPLLIDLNDNTALDLGKYNCLNPVGTDYDCTTIVDYSSFTYDSSRHQMLMFGGGHATTFRDDVDVFHFDTLSWQRAYIPTPCSEMTASNLDSDRGAWNSTNHPFSRHTYDLLAFANNTNELIMMAWGAGAGSGNCEQIKDWYPDGRVAHYDPETKKWVFGASMTNSWEQFASVEFDPQSGLIVIVDSSSIWTYDPVNKAIKKRVSHNAQNMGYANNLVYFPPNGNMYYIARGTTTKVFEVVLDRQNWGNSTVTNLNLSGNVPSSQESGFAFDSTNEIIGGGIRNGNFIAFDPVLKKWNEVPMNLSGGGSNLTQYYHAIDYDPIDNVFIFIGSDKHTWAYRYSKPKSGTPLPPTTLRLNTQ